MNSEIHTPQTLLSFVEWDGFFWLNPDEPYNTHEDEFDMATKDLKIILSKNKKICANSEKSDTWMGVYLKRFCDPKKLNVYEFIIG